MHLKPRNQINEHVPPTTFEILLLLGSSGLVHGIGIDQIATNDKKSGFGFHPIQLVDQRRKKANFRLPSARFRPTTIVQPLGKTDGDRERIGILEINEKGKSEGEKMEKQVGSTNSAERKNEAKRV